MTNKQKFLIIILILALLSLIISLFSYFDFNWFKPKKQDISLIAPKTINYKLNEESKYWPSDFPKILDFKVLYNKETQYSNELIIIEKNIEFPYPILPTINIFKNYFNLNNWEITKEDKNDDLQTIKIIARREGYMVINLNLNKDNKSMIYIRYEYNPQNPLKPSDKQILGDLPPFFPKYLVPKNSKVGGYNEGSNSYSPILFSEESVKFLYDFYLSNLKQNNWNILAQSTNDFGSEIRAYNSLQKKNINIKINPVNDKLRSIIILLDK